MAAATSALASVVVPEAAAAAAGSMAANSAAAAAARAMAAMAAAAGGGGNCRRPGLAWKGVLSWMSGRSCWSWALRGSPNPLLPRATPSAGSVASLPSCVFSRRPSWVHGDPAALADISGASGTVGGVNNAFLHRSASGHRREPDFLDSCPHPEAAPEKSWMAKGGEVR